MQSDRLPQTLRNRNLLIAGWTSAGFASLAISVNAASSFGLGVVFGLVLIVIPVALAIAYFVRWSRNLLIVTTEEISIGGVGTSVSIPWSEIDRFEIREPRTRTLTMLHFSPWADQGQVHLRDGTKRWITAIQPYHGFTILGFIALGTNTKADEVIDWLNRLRSS